MKWTFYEHFAGGGGARAGLGAHWACTFANDIDPKKAASYAANFGAQGLLVDDVANLKPADLPGTVDLAWASPPCQDLSEAGKGAGLEGERSGAFRPFMKLMQALRDEQRAPRIVVLENVEGLISRRDGTGFDEYVGALTECRYRFGAIGVNAELFVPQRRLRVFVVGVDEALSVPADIVAGPSLPFHPRALVAACSRQKARPIWWRLPVPPMRNTTLIDVLEDDLQSDCWDTPTETDRIIAMMAALHLAKVEDAKRAGKLQVGGLFRRTRDISRWEVQFDGVAGCLRVPTGGSSRQSIMFVDGDAVRSRLLSPREAARLMGLPDSYKLPANTNEALGLMGDGVVAPVVRHLAANILEPILQASASAVTSNPSDRKRLAEIEG